MKKPRRPRQTESEITAAIRAVLKSLRFFHWKHWSGPMTHPKGISDLLGIKTVAVSDLVKAGVDRIGVFTAIEVKTPSGQVTREQRSFIEAVRRAGGIAFVVRSVDEVLDGLGMRDRFV